MSTPLAGTNATARDVLMNLSGRNNPSQREIEKLYALIREHDFSNPLSKTVQKYEMGELNIEGNHLVFKDLNIDRKSFHVLTDGQIVGPDLDNAEKWEKDLSALGWTVKNGSQAKLVDEQAEKGRREERKMHFREVQAFGNRSRILMAFMTWMPDGKRSLETIGTRSHHDGGKSAEKLTGLLMQRELCIAGSKDTAAAQSIAIIETEIRRLEEVYECKVDYQIAAPSWREGIVEMKTLDTMLNPETDTILFSMEASLDQPEPRMTQQTMATLEAKVRRYSEKKKILGTKGRLISSLGQAILGESKDPFRKAKWKRTRKEGLIISERLTIRDGLIGGEIIVEKNGKRILRLLNKSFAISGITLPESTLASMVGNKLRDYVDHPYLNDDMIITKVKKTKNGARGTYADEGNKTYEAA